MGVSVVDGAVVSGTGGWWRWRKTSVVEELSVDSDPDIH